MKLKNTKKIVVTDILISIFLILCGAMCLLPIINTLAISFSDRTSAAMGEVGLFPVNFTLASYKAIMEESQFAMSFLTSVKRVILGGVLNMFMAITMAYPLSKEPRIFHSKKCYMWFVIVTMMFSGGLVPSFMIVRYVGIMDTIWALVLPSAVPVFNVILLMNFFKAIPVSLEEAAYVDGANPLFILWKIYLPLSKAALATITLFAVVNHWNAFFDGKIYINSIEKLPLQTYIQSLASVLKPEQMATMTPEEIKEKLAMSSLTFNSAKVIVSMVPILLIYPFLQKYFVTGIVMGAVKE
ncbi:MAG: carbohydrate ABC transporter permease [Oscillospiraceae bacterium]